MAFISINFTPGTFAWQKALKKCFWQKKMEGSYIGRREGGKGEWVINWIMESNMNIGKDKESEWISETKFVTF